MLATSTKVPIQFRQFAKYNSSLFAIILIDVILIVILVFAFRFPIALVFFVCVTSTALCLREMVREWRILRKGSFAEARIIDLDDSDQNEERYDIEYSDGQDRKFVGSFVNYLPARGRTEPRTFQPRYQSDDIVLIVIDPDNPANFAQWTGKYESV
jgi:hypothetical protein